MNEGLFRECAIVALTKAVETMATSQKDKYGGSVERAAWGVAEDLEVMICRLLNWYYADGFRDADKAIYQRMIADIAKKVWNEQGELL